MNFIQTIIIAIVEGLTEFLPVSSTGHMIITEALLGVESTDFVKAFTVIIQFGAIFSVVVLYWSKFSELNHTRIFSSEKMIGKSFRERLRIYIKRAAYKYDFYWKLFIAFIPAAVIGLLFSNKIDELLENVQVIAAMLILGGIFMLFVDKLFAKTSESQSIKPRKAFIIGLCQCISMIPGVSRSMATIVGGMSQRLTRRNAAEFSFFLAVPTMFAASAYKLYKLVGTSDGIAMLDENFEYLLLGTLVAFVVALFTIKFFINFVSKYGFKLFGYYRIIIGALLLILLYMGYDLAII
jgi:undecaprenyl-diphosphatase